MQHFDFDKKTWLKTNASNYVITKILFQITNNETLKSIVFMSKRMFSTKCNYEIYDKKLLTIIKIFEKWRFECAKTSIECFIKIFTNHQNLKYFMISKNFNKRQIKWTKFLSKFNFLITFRSNKQNIKTNNLIRRTENFLTNKENERKVHNRKKFLKKSI